MAHVGDAYFTGSVPLSTSLGIGVRPVPDPDPTKPLNVRLSDGANFYTAGITVVSGNGPVNQGSPNLLSSGWPVKLTDGSSVLGVPATPVWITGTVHVENPGASGGGGNSTLLSGSITALQIAGAEVTPLNPMWVTGSVYIINQVAGGAASNVNTVSGSITGLLVGGVAVSNANPVPITGTIALARAVDVATLPKVTVQSGSITALQIGGIEVASGNPVWVTGSVFVLNQGGAGSNVTAQSGSVTGLLVGGVSLSNANPVPVTGTVHLADVSAVTGSVSLARAIDIATMPNVTIANPQSTVTLVSGSVSGLLYGGVAASSQNPFWITGSVGVTDSPSSVTLLSGSISGLLVGGVALSNANPVPITGSITLASVGTITGSVTLATAPSIASGSVTGLLVGGVAVSNINPVPVTGTVHLADVSTITGSVSLARAVDVASMPNLSVTNTVTVTGTVHLADVSTITGSVTLAASPNVTTLSGSVAGLLYGGVAAGQTNPFWVTGSVFVLNQGAAASNVTAVSGSVTGLLVGGVSLSNANPVPVTGTIHLADVSAVTGTIALARAVDIATMPNVTVANPQTTVTLVSGSVSGLLVGGVSVSSANPIPVTGSITITNVSTITGSVTLAAAPNVTALSGSVSGLLIGGVALSNANPVPVTGTFTLASVGTITGSVSLAAAPSIASGSVTGLLVGGVALANANPLPISGTVVMAAMPQAYIDAGNSSTTLLTASANFIGTAVDVTRYGIDSVSVLADAAGVLFMQYSQDNSHWDFSSSYAVVSGVANVVAMGCEAQYYRTFYANGVGAQSAVFRLQTIHKPITGYPDSIQIGTPIDPGADVLLSKTVLAGKALGGTGYIDISATTSNGLSVASASGSVTGLLVGGVSVAGTNPIPVTGTISIANVSTITGSITLASVGTITGSVTLAAAPNVTVLSGSVSGLLVGGVALSNVNPVPITGTIHIADVSTITGSITLASVGTITGSVTLAASPNVFVISGSVSGLLVGGVAVSTANPFPVSAQATTNVIGAVYADSGQLLSGSTVRTVQYSFATGSVSGSNLANQLIAPQGANNMIRVLSMDLLTSGPVNVQFQSTGSVGTTTNISSIKYLPASGGFVLPYSPHGWFQTKANEGLNVALTSATTVGVDIVWIIVGP